MQGVRSKLIGTGTSHKAPLYNIKAKIEPDRMFFKSPKPRPHVLTWLCIGSTVFGSLWIIMFLTAIFFVQTGNVTSKVFPGIVIEYLNAGYLFMIAEILLTGLGIIAVKMMWRMKKKGFYLYAAVKTSVYFLPVLLIGSHHLTFPALLTTSILIIAYGIIFTD